MARVTSAALRSALAQLERGPLDPALLRAWRSSSDAATCLLAAAALTWEGDWGAARDVLARLVAPAGQRAAVLLAAAALYGELGQFDTALRCLERAAAVPASAGAALRLMVELAGRIGWHRDAIEAAERLIADEPQHAATQHRLLQQRLATEGDYAAALAHLRAAGQPASAERAWDAAALLCHAGSPDEVRAAVAEALRLGEASAAGALRAARLLIDAGAFSAAVAEAHTAAQRDAANVEAHLTVGALHLWHGETGAALAASRRALGLDPQCAAAQRQRGAALVLLGRGAEALEALDAALATDQRDGEAQTWRAEALLLLERLAEAAAVLDAHAWRSDSNYWVVPLLQAIVALRQQAERQRSRPARLRRYLGMPTALSSLRFERLVDTYYELAQALRTLVPDAQTALAAADAQAQLAVFEATRHALLGNRSRQLTARQVGQAELRGMSWRSPRDASVRVLSLIKTAEPERVLRELDRIIADYPDSSLPTSYRGELRLWLGDYDRARTDLESALAQRQTTRWAYYGLALLANVEEAPQRALAYCERSVQVIGNIGPSIHIHRGEALRRLGRTDAARRELRRACDLAPTRVAGRLNLALADGDAGERAAEAAGFVWLREQAPGLLSDAGAELDLLQWADEAPLPRDALRALLEHMLRLMRGNRATSLTTWIGRGGRLRVAGAVVDGVPAWERFRADAANRRPALRRLLEQAGDDGA